MRGSMNIIPSHETRFGHKLSHNAAGNILGLREHNSLGLIDLCDYTVTQCNHKPYKVGLKLVGIFAI